MKLRGFEVVSDWQDKDIHLPQRQTAASAGYDIEAAADCVLPAGGMVLVPTGLKAYMQAGEVLTLNIRSSMAGKQQLMLANRRLEYHLGEGYLAPIRLITLQKDTYMLYRDVMVMKGVSGSQLKPINVIRNEFQRKFLVTLDEAKENPDI